MEFFSLIYKIRVHRVWIIIPLHLGAVGPAPHAANWNLDLFNRVRSNYSTSEESTIVCMEMGGAHK
jgi:hypothetical protein